MPGMRYQPQGLARINRRNPLARGLVFLAPMAGGHDLVNLVAGKNATTGRATTSVNKLGKFASFPATAAVDFPTLNGVLGSAQPASVGWVQQPIGATGLHVLAQFAVGSQPFMIFQSVNNAAYYFTAGLRGTSASAFGPTTGPLVNGQVDVCVLTSTGGFAANDGLTLFKSGVKHSVSGSSSFSNATSQPTSIGHRDGGADPWRGTIGCFAVWSRVLTDDEASSFNANPWQLFSDPEEDGEDIAAAEPASTSGALNATLAGAVLSASGSPVNTGQFSTALGNASMSGSGAASSQPSGSFSASLSSVSFSATGALLASGSLSAVMDGAQASMVGNVAQAASGTLTSTLAGAAMNAYGYEGAAPPVATKRYRPRILRRHFTN